MSEVPKLYIYYIGKKQDCFDDMTDNFAKAKVLNPGYEFLKFQSIEEIIKPMLEKPANGIFIDFSMIDSISEEFYKFILMVKSFGPFSKIPIFGMFNDKEQLDTSINLYTVGLNYSYIRGNDRKQFLANALYIITQNKSSCLKYATASGFELATNCFGISSIVKMDKETISIDTDIKGINNKTNIEFRLYDDFNAISYKVIEQETGKSPLLGFYQTTYEIPFCEPVQEDEKDLIVQESYLNWVESNLDELKSSIKPMYIFSKNQGFIQEVFSSREVHLKFNLNIRTEFNNSFLRLKDKIPSVVIFDISDLPSYQNLNEMMTEIGRWEEEMPFIIIMGHKSTSEALQKLYKYQRLISTTTKSSLKQVLPILEKLFNQIEYNKDEYKFKFTDKRAIARNILGVEITSFSENSITFITKEELPLYCVIEFTVPIIFHAIIIDPMKEFAVTPKGQQYQAFLMNITEDDSSYLRTFVNTLLKASPPKWEVVEGVQLPEALETNCQGGENDLKNGKVISTNNELINDNKSKL